MKHNSTVLHYFHHREHAVEEIKPTFGLLTAQHGSEQQGDIVRLYITLENASITQARFKCYGQVTMIAACEWLCCYLEGKPLSQVSTLTASFILKKLALSELHNHVAWRLIECLKKLKP